jgi:glycosyltransferase involved in cell wall biosynthesis
MVNRVCSALSQRIPWRIVYCAEVARGLHEEKFGYDSARGLVIENGVDFASFRFDPKRRAALRAAWSLDPHSVAIGCVGRFDTQKDHETVLRAISLLSNPRIRLLLAGAGCTGENPHLKEMVRTFGLADRLLALGPVHDMQGLLSALDLLVIGSAYGEALPVVGLEAAANQLPVVATTVGAVENLVLDPAHLAPPRNPAALASAIATALPIAVNRTGLPEMAAHLERLRLIHDFAITAARYEELYRAGAAISRPGRV